MFVKRNPVRSNLYEVIAGSEAVNEDSRFVHFTEGSKNERTQYGQFETVRNALTRKGAIRSVTYWLNKNTNTDKEVIDTLWSIAETIPTGEDQPTTMRAKANSDAFEAILDYIGKVGGNVDSLPDNSNMALYLPENRDYFIARNVMQAVAIGNIALTAKLGDIANTVGRVDEKQTS